MTEGATSVGQIGLDLVINQGQFNKDLGKISNIAKKAGKTIAAAFGIKKLVSFGKECVNLGSDLEEVQNVVDSTFTEMSSKVDQFAKDAIQSYGLSETMAKRYAGTLGAMAKAFGFAEKDAYDMATTLTGLAGDVASFYNISQDEAYTKIKSVFTGETESLKDLGVVMTQTALDNYALANGFGKTTSAMTEAEKVALRYKFVQEQLTTAAGDFSRTSDSWANQVRVLTLQFDSFKAAVGQGLINALTPAIRVINELMSHLVTLGNAFSQLTGYFVKSKQAVNGVEAITGSYKAATAASDQMAESGTKAADSVSKAAQKAAKKVRSIMGFDQINKVDKNEDTSSGSTGNSGGVSSGMISAELEGEQEIIEPMPKAYEKLAKSIDRLKDSCREFSEVLSGGLQWGYENILKPLGEWTMSKLAPAAIDILSGAIRILTEAMEIAAPIGKKIWDEFLAPIASFTGGVAVGVLELLAGALDKIADFADEHTESLTRLAEGLLILFGVFKTTSFITNAISAIKAFEGGIVSMSTALDGIFGAKGITRTLAGGAEKLISAFLAIPGPVKIGIAVFAALVAAGVLIYKNWDTIKEKLKIFADYFKGEFDKIKSDVENDIEILSNAFEKIKEFPEKIKKWFSEKVNAAGDWFERIKESFSETLEDLGDNIPDLSEVNKKITDAVGVVKAKITSYFSDKKEQIKSKWNSLTASVKDKKANLKAQVASKASEVKKAWDNISAKWKDKKAEFSLKFSAAASDLKKWVNTNVIDKVNGKFKKVPILKNHLIPHLAQGGYVAKNTPQLAMIGDNRHQGEVVSPEKKLEEMAVNAAKMAMGAGNAEMIGLLRQILAAIMALSLVVNLDGKKISENVIKRINEITDATGKTPIKI